MKLLQQPRGRQGLTPRFSYEKEDLVDLQAEDDQRDPDKVSRERSRQLSSTTKRKTKLTSWNISFPFVGASDYFSRSGFNKQYSKWRRRFVFFGHFFVKQLQQLNEIESAQKMNHDCENFWILWMCVQSWSCSRSCKKKNLATLMQNFRAETMAAGGLRKGHYHSTTGNVMMNQYESHNFWVSAVSQFQTSPIKLHECNYVDAI